MSTFDGIVDEFPSVRIDYFRHHPGRDPPQACFLSHVHSDHLQGLETLKMPFVYCSAATKKILLRMEKYPHRINFARGILEARKQTYKHLRLILRALPLETPVELELGPKSRIRVTLFDANHCPGAVMFLIEGDGKAILYTGDVRAEPWWTNSITRNPILIPYACGKTRLDCVYLDTTFATHNDVYRTFPTKAEGLQELLARIEKCPRSSTFYFRSWTLGYEDVWIALSNHLQASVHVDDYQLRLFKSLVDDANTIGCGASLAGFEFGNQYQGGCLTDNVEARIHSCEPGSECYDRVKKLNDIVWITPIISRLEDGTELSEIGAGGGGGDLYHAPQLELVDEVALKSLEQLCASTAKHTQALAQLSQAFAAAREKGELNISLEGLGLDQEEVTLKDFVQLISAKDKFLDANAGSYEQSQRVIRFPYSRHSSYSELSAFVSSFRPKDVCPCTVDIGNWSEDVSIESLFGEHCSEKIFRHDEQVRAKVREKRIAQTASNGNKRKRATSDGDSTHAESQRSQEIEEVFRSARTSIREEYNDSTRQSRQHADGNRPVVIIPPPVKQLQQAISERFNQDSNDLTRSALSQEFPNSQTSPTHELAHAHANAIPTEDQDEHYDSPYVFPPSPSSSAFQPQDDEDLPILDLNPASNPTAVRPRRTHNPPPPPPTLSPSDLRTRTRTLSRRDAYDAAKTALDHADFSAWRALRLRSIGWTGHTEEEEELL